MKKTLLIFCLFAAFNFTKVNAQIYNSGFETWTNDTAYFDGLTLFKPDTFEFSDPAQWTTTNALSGADTFGHKFFVNQTGMAHTGSSAVELTTNKLDSVFISFFNAYRQLTIPGLALNGRFPLDLSSSLVTGGLISPTAIPGSGQPWTKRLASIKGFYSYAPVLKDTANNYMDSCMIWAILRKGDVEVASAQFSSNVTTGGYTAFSADFVYKSCEDPDTLVILLAASVPNFGSILSGYTGLVAGSILRVDDLDVDTLPASFNYPPIAVNDVDTTTKDNSKNVLVKLNDDDCNDPVSSLSLGVTTQPVHGSAVAGGNALIVYTPATGYVGIDSFRYSISDGVSISYAVVRMVVLNSTGINEANDVKVSMYPVPASKELNVQFENNGKATIRVFDAIGNLVYSSVTAKNINTISTETLANGVYGIQITNAENNVIARSKFTVSK